MLRGLVLLSLSLSVVCGLTSARAGDPPDGGEAVAPGGTPFTKPTQAAVDDSVKRGVAWLRDEQRRDGRFGTGTGETALALLALRHSGVPAEDKTCRRAARFLVRKLPDGRVYGAALGVLALLAQDEPGHRIIAEKLVADLVTAQCKNGQWDYTYRARKVKRDGDNSNTQFALLALAAARAQGIEVPPEPFARAREFLRKSQNEDGGFGYSDRERSRSYAAMTAGAAMCLAFCVAVDKDEPAGLPGHAEDAEVRRALAWLAKNFDPENNTGITRAFGNAAGRRSDASWRHYWLWSLERAAAAASVDRLGDHDWYARGARVLLDRQRDDDSWRDPERGILATSFALLFFRRSTRIAITPRGGAAPAITPSSRDASK